MHIIARESLTATPWKNGGGVTRQIASFPAGSDLASFDWRISTAEVAQDGPFSRFEGVDRRLYILAGAGLDLTFGAGGTRRILAGEHIDFAGEAEVHGGLVGGAVTDLNIMVRRARQRMHVTPVTVSGSRALELPWPAAAVFVRDGQISSGDRTVRRSDTILLDAGDAGTIAVNGAADLLLIGFEPA